MTDKKFKQVVTKIMEGEIDFFSPVDLSAMEFNTMNRIQLLLILSAINDIMIKSLDNWEGG